MVMGWLAFMGLMFSMPTLAAGNPRLELVPDASATELGRPVLVEVRGYDLAQGLNRLSLQALEQDFGVVFHEYAGGVADPTDPSVDLQVLTIKLYPRRTGRIALPSLSLGELRTRSQYIDVREGTTGKQPIRLRIQTSSTSVWTRQQILVAVEVSTGDRFASLHVEEMDVPGFEVIPVPPTRATVTSGDQTRTVLHTGWVLFPLTAGDQVVSLPPVRYRLHGVFQRVFYLPLLELRIRPLPPYIPPVIPVGRVSINSQLVPDSLLRTGSLAHWDVILQGAASTPSNLPPVLRQIKSTAALQILPPESRRSESPDSNGVHGQVTHRIPFKPLTNGRLALPELRVQYFDPDSGRLVTVTHQPPSALVLSLTWRIIFGLLVCLLIYGSGILLFRYWQQRRHYHRKRCQALAHVTSATDAVALRHGLLKLADAEGWPENLSLTAWADRWRSRFATRPEFNDLMTRLSAACYSATPDPDLTDLRSRLLQHVAIPRRIM